MFTAKRIDTLARQCPAAYSSKTVLLRKWAVLQRSSYSPGDFHLFDALKKSCEATSQQVQQHDHHFLHTASKEILWIFRVIMCRSKDASSFVTNVGPA
jgi:hypothetical protein